VPSIDNKKSVSPFHSVGSDDTAIPGALIYKDFFRIIKLRL